MTKSGSRKTVGLVMRLLDAGASEGIREWGIWRARERAYNGGLGAKPPAGVQGQSPWSGGQGTSPPDAGGEPP